MISIKEQYNIPLKRSFGIGLNVIANSLNIILAVIFQWEFSVVVVCLYIQNFILMSFISLRIYRLMGKNYIKLDSRHKVWSPEYSNPVGTIVMSWITFAFLHFLYFIALNEVKVFSLAMTATNASVILLSCGGYFLYQCYGFFWVKPNYNIKRFKINGKSQPVILINTDQQFKSTVLAIIHFLPLFFVVFMLNQSATTWLSGLLVIVLCLELVAQLIVYDKKKYVI